MLKFIKKIRKKAKPERLVAFIAVLAMVVGLMQPASIVHAADDTGDQRQMEKIEKFTDTLVKGATKIDGKYVWNAKTDADDHRFTFRVDYSMSGVKDLEPGAIKIWIPKTILKDRSGKYADYMDLSIPSEDEYNSASKEDRKDVNYVWKKTTDEAHKNCIEITNVTQRTAGENGYFEVAYITNERTFEYRDEVKYDADQKKYTINEKPQSDPFYADISVTNISDGKPQTVTASAGRIPVYINTTAGISSTDKRYPNKMYRKWQSSWGAQPDEAKDKYFLVWEIVSKIKNDPTQPFTFTLKDTPVSKELHLLGYSMGSQSGPFAMDKNYVKNQRNDNDRYDYVLTYYDPAEFKGKDYYELKNSVKATVTPEDGIDDPTSANSSKMWEWDTPKFVHPTGHFYGEKYGDNNWQAKFGYYHDYSSYSLDKMQKKDINSIDTFRYYISDFGYPYPWTRDGDADDPLSYGNKKVTYQLSDDELYLEDKITTKDAGTDQLEFGIPEGAHRLDSSDYQFLYADWNVSSQFRTYDEDEKKFVTDPNGKYKDGDVIHFWVKTNEKDKHDGEYKEVASYNLGSGKASISDSSIVKELTHDRITFKSDKDDPSVTGIRFTTSNAYYYTKIEAYPMVRLKNSDYVMKKLFRDENPKNVTEDNCKNLIRLHNFAQSNVYQAEEDAKVKDDNLIYGVKVYAFDRAIRPKKESEIHKHIVSTGSNKIKKKYVIRWKITPRETLTTDSGTDYLVQNSGTFYDLLPKGTHLQKGSIDVETENGMLSHSSFSYSVEEDYKNSGRDLIKVSVPVQAKYYNLYLNAEMSWDAIHDYGTKINNPVAYETGNDEIYNGYPDDDYVDGTGAVHKLPLSDVNKAYMTRLDPKCTTNRFIYDEEPHDIDTLTAAVSGLKKQIKDSHDASYSYETYTTTNGSYSYKIRFANTMTDKAKNMIFFDSLENYNLNGKHSDWHGTLKRFDVSQLKQKGIEPVIYVSKTADLSIDAHHDLTDTSVWEKVTKNTNLSEMHAFAIDCRKTSDGKDFVLNQGESVSATVYMQAPASVAEEKEGQYDKTYPKAYNNIYIQDTIMSGETSSDFFIHQDYTEIRYRVSADISIHKQNADDAKESIEGAKYTLKGTSDYGTEVNEEVTTGKQGDAVFEGIEKGTYTLKESYSPIDWLLDRTEYTVKVDGTGKITCDEKEIEKTEKITLKASPRIHGDISFMKYSTAGNSRAVTGAKFRLSGKSKYGTDVMEYATSDAAGKVKFENIEWGSYKLKEVETPDGYIPDSTEYTAVISDSGIGGIEDAEMLKTGSAVIRNEPYHTVEISKQSSYDGAVLSGAEFKLTGTSDYGTPYDKTATSGDNGLAKFDGLEAGTYIIQETKSPKDYFLDSTKHIVKVNKNDTYTIDGLNKNDSGKYRQNNTPEPKGKIIVRKKWKDNKNNEDIEKNPPVIHITTDVNKVPTYAEWYCNPYSGCTFRDFNYDKIKKIKYANVTANAVPKNAVRLDKDYDNPNAKYKIYGWLDNDGTLYYWSNAQSIRLSEGGEHGGEMFYRMNNVTYIDLSHIDASYLTDMSNMFATCPSLTSIIMPTIDPSRSVENVDMSDMFANCRELVSIDFSNFNTSKAKSMRGMFFDCNSLPSKNDDPQGLDLSDLKTANVTDMGSMFAGCKSLTSLDLSGFKTSKVTDMSSMFEGCVKLNSLSFPSSFNTSEVTDMYAMFANCSALEELNLSSFNTKKVTDMSYMFGNRWSDPYRYGFYEGGGCSKLESLNISNFDTSNVTNMEGMFSGCRALSSLSVSNFSTPKVTNMRSMFAGCSALKELNLSSFNTANVTDMSYMFGRIEMSGDSQEYARVYGCENLSNLTIDYSNFITTKVKDMSGMFVGCDSLSWIDILSKLNTSNVTKFQFLFCGYSSSDPIDISKIDMSNASDITGLFYKYSASSSIDLSKLNMSHITSTAEMFGHYSSSASINLSDLNTSNVTDMSGMFRNYSSSAPLDFSSFDTSSCKDMSKMFSYCTKIKAIDITHFKTEQVTDMRYMFYNCQSLTSLDLSNFNTSKIAYISWMFCDCYNLKNIYVSDKWNADNVADSQGMFHGCDNLPNYSSSSTDKTHANYGTNGYLTYKAVPKAKADTSGISFASRLVSMILSRLAVPAHAADSASYVSTDTDHCKITKDGDTWTYEFSVADDSAKYYAYEESVEGYTSSNDVNSYGITTKDEPLTITNTANDLPKEPKPASLSLSKTADGKQLVESDKPAEKYSHTSNIDDTGKANGTYSDRLNTNGDVVTIPGASKLHVKLYYSTESTSYDWACVWAGSHPDYTAYGNYSSSKLGSFSGKIGGGAKTSMSSANVIEGDIDGDTVTFGFRSDGSVGYYGYYAVVTDAKYISVKQPDGSVKWYEWGDSADIPSSYSDMTYMFDITLKNSDSSKLSGTKIFGNTVFTDGKAQVGVKAGETKTFSGLPGGTTYTITEKDYNDFYTESKNASGTLKAGDTAEAKFTNHYQKPKTPDTPKEYSSFKLKKNVTGFFQNAQNYTFDVSFRKLDPNTEYTLSDGTKFTSDSDGYGYVQTRLSDKESVAFTSLPVGAQYRVTEEGGDWSSAYRITNSTDKGDIAQSAGSAEKNESLSTKWETADSGEGITVTYTNTVKKYQNLVLRKAVTGGKATDKFRFRIDFAKLYETVKSDAGTIIPDDDGNANVDVYLNAGDEIVFKNIPVNTEYKITEKANAGKASYTIKTDAPDGVTGGKFAKSADENKEAMKDLSTAEETVDEGENATVTFLNDMPKTTSVTLKKQVSGAFADRNKFFKFTVSLTGADKKQSYSFDYTNGSSSHDGTKNAASITTDENGHGTADIWLKHNDTVIIKNIPLSAKYSIAENPGEYVPSITINGEKADTVSERQAAPDVIVFTNTNTAILPTGLRLKTTISMVCAAIIFLVFFFSYSSYFLRRKGKKENEENEKEEK